jgi:3-hydroxyacyl-CoA dehydrogenase
MGGPVTLTHQDGVALITVDQPPVNALSTAVKSALLAALSEAAADPAVAGIVLTGAGGAFIAGADLREMDVPPVAPFLPDVIAAIDGVGKPTVAALGGAALGGGLEVALACRLRVARAGAVLGFPEVNVGLVPGSSGTQRLLRHVDFATTARLITAGKPIPAEEAERLGLVDRVVPVDTPTEALVAEAMALLRARMADGTLPGPTAARAAAALPDAATLAALRAETMRAAKGRAAPLKAFDLLVETAPLTFADGLQRERALFLSLREGEESRALRRLFLAEREAGRAALKAVAAVPPVAHVGVVGAGLMGAGIAFAALSAGLTVTVIETDDAALARGRERIGALISGAVQSGRLTASKAAALERALMLSVDLAALAPCDLVIEAVFESLAVKHDVFRRIEAVTRPEALLASNTSYLDLDAIAGAVADPSRVLGLHFFSPAHVMRLVEVVRGARTSPAALAAGVGLAQRMRKIPVVTGNCEGFCGNRILRAYRLVAEAMVEDGASPAEVDAAMVEFGFAMGPFAVQDMAGLAIAAANRALSPTFRPDGRRLDLVERLVAEGRLGRKAGRGWYRYPEGARQGEADPALDALLAAIRREKGVTPRSFSSDAITAALIGAIRSEAQAILAEGVVADPDSIALVMVHGYGFPAHKIAVLAAHDRHEN